MPRWKEIDTDEARALPRSTEAVDLRQLCPESAPAREGLVEAIGVQLFRTKVKRRKASWEGKPASGGKAQSPSVSHGVVATGWLQSLQALPKAVWRVPFRMGRYAEQRKKENE